MQLKSFTVPEDSLRGKTVFLTGASGGLGRALGLACARAGATVILSGRNIARLERLYDEIEQLGAPQPAIAPLDLATAAAGDYDSLAELVSREFGAIDGLVHCAALLGERTPLDQYDIPTWCRVMHVNVTAPLILTQVLLPQLRKPATAAVLFVSSRVAHEPAPYWGAYAASKAALESVRAMLAGELAGVTSLRVNSVNPGPLRTAMRAAAYPAEDPNTLPAPESVTDAFVYLLSDAGAAIRGKSVTLAGT